jgi:WD40 repeat protein
VDREYQARIFLFRVSNMQIISAVDGHQGMVTSLAFSPDGKILASSGFDLFVKFWEIATGHLLGQVHVADTPNSLAFSPDGTTLAVASNLDVAFIDVSTMKIEQSLQEANGKDLAYSPEEAQVYINSLGNIKIIDPRANAVILSFPDRFGLIPTVSVATDGSIVGVTYETPERVDGFALSPDGERITSYTMSRSVDDSAKAGNIRLATWDAKTGKYLSEIQFSGGMIRVVKFSPEGNRLALAIGNEVWLWDTASLQVERKLTGHAGEVIDLAFTSDGANILSAGMDGTVRIWPVKE